MSETQQISEHSHDPMYLVSVHSGESNGIDYEQCHHCSFIRVPKLEALKFELQVSNDSLERSNIIRERLKEELSQSVTKCHQLEEELEKEKTISRLFEKDYQSAQLERDRYKTAYDLNENRLIEVDKQFLDTKEQLEKEIRLTNTAMADLSHACEERDEWKRKFEVAVKLASKFAQQLAIETDGLDLGYNHFKKSVLEIIEEKPKNEKV